MNLSAAEIAVLEGVAARGWPAEREGRIGAWRLHASSGYSGRINACWPLGDPSRDLDAAIDAVEAWYVEQGLPPLFKAIDTAASVNVLDALAERLYRPRTTTLVMVAPAAACEVTGIRLTSELDDGFAAVFLSAGPAGSADPGDARERLATLARVPAPRAFATGSPAGKPIAIGAAAVEGAWAGVFAMRTDPAHRRRGLARRVLAALTSFAAEQRAKRVYLQVEAGNAPAIALYQAAGFVEAYRYRYWEWSNGRG